MLLYYNHFVPALVLQDTCSEEVFEVIYLTLKGVCWRSFGLMQASLSRLTDFLRMGSEILCPFSHVYDWYSFSNWPAITSLWISLVPS